MRYYSEQENIMRKACLFTLVYFCVNAATVFAAPGDTTWTQTYGGYSDDRTYLAQQTNDGGYITGGLTLSFGAGGQDTYLVKTDSFGNTQWTNTYGWTASDVAFSLQQTTDGGYILAGWTNSWGAGWADFYLVKTDAAGNELWTQTHGGTATDQAWSVQQTTDGGYIIAGSTESFGAGFTDFYLVKTNVIGDTLWTRTYGGTSSEIAYSVQQTTDGGYITAGYTGSFGAGSFDFYVVKTNAGGGTMWTQTYGGTSGEIAYSVQQTSDGGYIIAGSTDSFGAGFSDYYLVKTDASGNTLWTRTYGGTDSDLAQSVQQTADGGYIIAGETYSFGAGGVDYYLVKTDALGDTLWTHTYGGYSADFVRSVQQTTNGDYIVAGYTNSFGAGSYDFYLVKVEGLCCDVDIVPDSYPVNVPPGGSFGWTGYLGNPTPSSIVTDVWYGAVFRGNFYEQGRFLNVPLNPGRYLQAHLNQAIPHQAPEETYEYIIYCGDYSSNVCDSASFSFNVTGARLEGGNDEWVLDGGWGKK